MHSNTKSFLKVKFQTTFTIPGQFYELVTLSWYSEERTIWETLTVKVIGLVHQSQAIWLKQYQAWSFGTLKDRSGSKGLIYQLLLTALKTHPDLQSIEAMAFNWFHPKVKVAYKLVGIANRQIIVGEESRADFLFHVGHIEALLHFATFRDVCLVGHDLHSLY